MFAVLAAAAALLLVAAILLAVSPPVRTAMLRPRRLLFVLLAGVLFSFGSTLISAQRLSGTGELTSRGYPKPFLFRWDSREGEGSGPHRVNGLYFAGNTLFHTAAVLLLLSGYTLLARPRGR